MASASVLTRKTRFARFSASGSMKNDFLVNRVRVLIMPSPSASAED
jgi:hypothetical protein